MVYYDIRPIYECQDFVFSPPQILCSGFSPDDSALQYLPCPSVPSLAL
jgi:hypothetical protein